MTSRTAIHFDEGKNTVWVEFGEELAITLGDWMINQAYDVLVSNGDRSG